MCALSVWCSDLIQTLISYMSTLYDILIAQICKTNLLLFFYGLFLYMWRFAIVTFCIFSLITSISLKICINLYIYFKRRKFALQLLFRSILSYRPSVVLKLSLKRNFFLQFQYFYFFPYKFTYFSKITWSVLSNNQFWTTFIEWCFLIKLLV